MPQSPRVDAEEKVNWASPSAFFECLVETFIPRVGGAPNFILERLVDVIFGV